MSSYCRRRDPEVSASGKLRLVGVLLVLSACSGPSDTDDPRASRIENGLLPITANEEELGTKASITQRMDHYRVPGVSIAVFDHGEIIWAKGFGVASVDTNVDVDENTLFQAASISKPVSAVGALLLVQEGTLRLEDDVNDSLTSWQVPLNGFAAEDPVTLRGLLNHSAGVTVHGFPGYQRHVAVPSLANVLNGEEPANTPRIEVDIPVDSVWRYSGGGYTVVQQLMIDVTDQAFPGYMAHAVLRPVGMANSTFEQPLPEELLGNAASGHQPGLGAVAGGHHNYPEMAAAGLWTTAQDLALFAISVHKSLAGDSGGVLDRTTATEMLTERKGNYGLGVALSGDQQSLRASHTGINQGFDSKLVTYPTTGSGAVVMANSNMSHGLIEEIIASIALEYEWPGYPIAEQRATKPFSAEQLEMYPATYEIEEGFTVSIERQNDRLFMVIPHQGTTEIFRAQPDEYLFVTGFPFPPFNLTSDNTGPAIQFLGP